MKKVKDRRKIRWKNSRSNILANNCCYINYYKYFISMNNKYVNEILDFYPFGDDKRYRGKYLLENTQNAKNWIVGKINKEGTVRQVCGQHNEIKN